MTPDQNASLTFQLFNKPALLDLLVTRVIAALGGPDLPTICENVFSDLFLYTPAAGEDGLVRLRYGAPEDISRNCR